MSNNFYADFTIGSDTTVTVRMHIGKAVQSEAGYGISTFSGEYFPTVSAWVDFLRHNAARVNIVDEYGTHQQLEEFIEFMEDKAKTSDAQIAAVNEAGCVIHPEPRPSTGGNPEYWVDSATGKLFFGGVFF